MGLLFAVKDIRLTALLPVILVVAVSLSPPQRSQAG
jgi:hypothetical protein